MPEVEEIQAPAIEETTAPASQEPQGETAPESVAGETAPPEAPKPQGGFQKRIDRLTREREERAREAEYWRNLALQNQNKPAEAPKAEPKDDGPKEEDFATAAEYVKAVAAHAVKTDREARQKADEEQARQAAEAALSEKIRTDLQTFRAAHPDFDDAMEEANFNTSNLLDREIRESEVGGPALLYHFAKNPDDANRIAKMTDSRAVAREIAKIEVRLSSAPAAKPQATPTSTPPPIKPIAASRSAVISAQIEDDAEYFRQRRAERAAKR